MTTNAFNDTLNIFMQYIGYKEPYTYAEWCNLPQDYKCAALYVQFYQQVNLAWLKANHTKNGTQIADSEDCLSIVMQYLMKNVEKIEQDEARFTPNYIYTVCHQCLMKFCKSDTNLRRIYSANVCIDTSWDMAVSYDFGKYVTLVDFWEQVGKCQDPMEKQFIEFYLYGDKSKMPNRFTNSKKFQKMLAKLQDDFIQFK